MVRRPAHLVEVVRADRCEQLLVRAIPRAHHEELVHGPVGIGVGRGADVGDPPPVRRPARRCAVGEDRRRRRLERSRRGRRRSRPEVRCTPMASAITEMQREAFTVTRIGDDPPTVTPDRASAPVSCTRAIPVSMHDDGRRADDLGGRRCVRALHRPLERVRRSRVRRVARAPESSALARRRLWHGSALSRDRRSGSAEQRARDRQLRRLRRGREAACGHWRPGVLGRRRARPAGRRRDVRRRRVGSRPQLPPRSRARGVGASPLGRGRRHRCAVRLGLHRGDAADPVLLGRRDRARPCCARARRGATLSDLPARGPRGAVPTIGSPAGRDGLDRRADAVRGLR